MTEGLSYPSLRCVLEYLEANKRVHITVRSPVLQRFEKTIPLHLDHLYLSNTTSFINDILYGVYEVSRAECTTVNGPKNWTRIQVLDARKIVNSHFLDGRRDIYVNDLEVGRKSLRLPANLQLKTKKLDTGFESLRKGHLKLVHPSSFPLRTLRTRIKNAENSNHDVIKTVPNLVISNNDFQELAWFTQNVATLTNLRIVIDDVYFGGNENYIRIIQNYLQTPRNTGACLEIRSMYNYIAHGLLSALKTEMKGGDVCIKKPDGRLSLHTPCSIPINSESAALFCGISKSDCEFSVDFKVEIVSIDAFTLIGSSR